MHWYEEDVKAAIRERQKCKYEPETIFYGSSSITLWKDIYDTFSEFKPVNLGFGGSTLAACVQFFDRIVAPVQKPVRLFLYAGDNDLGDGAQPGDVLKNYLYFRAKLRAAFDDIPFYYISIKPSVNRIEIIDKIKHTNLLIKDEVRKQVGNDHFINIFNKMVDSKGYPQKKYFGTDGLHLNEEGYEVWKKAIKNELMLTHQLL